METIDPSQNSDNFAILEALTVDSFEQFFKLHRLGDLETLHVSYKNCVESLKNAALEKSSKGRVEKATIDDLIAIISDYFYWVNLTARSGYVQRDDVKPAFLACVSEEIDAIYKTLQELGLRQVTRESFIVLGITEELDISYSTKGIVHLLENKFSEKPIPSDDHIKDTRTTTHRSFASIVPHESIPEDQSPQKLWAEIIHRKRDQQQAEIDNAGAATPRTPGDYQRRKNSITPSFIDQIDFKKSLPPTRRHRVTKPLFYGLLAAAGVLTTAGIGSQLSAKNTPTTTTISPLLPSPPHSMPQVPSPSPINATPQIERAHCLVEISPEHNPDLKNLLTSLQRNAPPIYHDSILAALKNIDIDWPDTISEENLQILLFTNLLDQLSHNENPNIQTFAATHRRNLRQFQATKHWSPGQAQTKLLYQALKPLRTID